jgi:hypothetical protein
MMKKSLGKLALRQETVRTLVDKELALVVGGDAQLVADSGNKACTTLAALPQR